MTFDLYNDNYYTAMTITAASGTAFLTSPLVDAAFMWVTPPVGENPLQK